ASAARRVGDGGEVVAEPVGVGRGGVVVVVGLGRGGGRVAARLRLGGGRGRGRDARLFLIAAAVVGPARGVGAGEQTQGRSRHQGNIQLGHDGADYIETARAC